MARQNLLVVDDDPRSRRVLEVTLRNAGYAVATAADGTEALARIEAAMPALVLSDTDMPGVDGYELCRRVKGDERFRDVPFLFLTEKTSVEDRIRGLELGADDYLSKPMYIKEVLARVRIALQRRERAQIERKEKRRFYGSLEDMGVVDLLTTVELGRKTGTIKLEHGGRRGAIAFADGRVIDAETGRLAGEDAVYRMLTWEDGTFEFDFAPTDRPHRVTAGIQQLLMEGMRRVDEWGRMLEQLPSIDTVFQVDYGELAERLAELPDEVNALLRLFDGHRTALHAIDDSTLSDLDALAAISRLYFEGIIFEVGAPKTPEAEDGDTVERPGLAGASDKGELRSWLSEMMAPGETDDVADEELADFGETAPPPPSAGLVDELLTSAVAMPRVRPSEGALPASLDLAPKGGAFAPPSGDTAPAPVASSDIDEDTRRVRDALRLESSEIPEAGRPAAPVEVVGATADGAARPALPPPAAPAADLGHDHFFASDDRDTLQQMEAEAPIRDEPPARMAYVVLGVGAAAILAGLGFLFLRDQVELREEPRGVLNTGWHDKALAARATPAAVPPVDAPWTLPSAEAADAAVKPAAPASAPAPDERQAPDAAEATTAAPPPASEPPAEAVPLRPENAKQFEDLLKEGVALHGKGDYQTAASRFEKAIGLRPASEEALLGFANSLLELDRGTEALKAAEKVARLNPKNARAHLIIGTVRQDSGDRDAAVAAYRKYLELAPDDRYAEQVRWIVEHRLR